MLKPTLTIAAACGFLAACSGDPTAPPTRQVRLVPAAHAEVSAADPTQSGPPDAPNCTGRTFSFFAQSGKNSGFDYRGVGGLAEDAGLSVMEAKAIVDERCAGD